MHRPHDINRKLSMALLVTLLFMGIEALAGWYANSLALVGDAGHMATDAGAILLSLFTHWYGSRTRHQKATHDYHWIEVYGALFSGLAIWGLAAFLLVESYQRLQVPQSVNGPIVLAIASIGLVANLVNLKVLHGSHDHINARAAYLHVLSDALGSVGAILSGAILWVTGWVMIDPIVTIMISLLILYSSLGLIRDAWALAKAR